MTSRIKTVEAVGKSNKLEGLQSWKSCKPGSASVSQHCGSTQYKTPPFPAVLPGIQGGRSKQIFTKRKLTS